MKEIKALVAWLEQDVFRRRVEGIWTHDRYPEKPIEEREIWWHVDLVEYDREFHDHGQALKAMAYCRRKTVFAGYGPSFAAALRNALRRAKEGVPETWGTIY